MLILWGKFSMLWCFTYLLPLLNFQYTGLLLTCTSVLLGIYIRSYSSISGLNAIHILSLTTYYRSLLLSEILFFKPFPEILISESPQHTTKVNPWVIWPFLLWLQRTICIRYWYHMDVYMCFSYTLLWYCTNIHMYFNHINSQLVSLLVSPLST